MDILYIYYNNGVCNVTVDPKSFYANYSSVTNPTPVNCKTFKFRKNDIQV